MSTYVQRVKAKAEAEYWGVVETCLVEFHEFDATTASAAINDLKNMLTMRHTQQVGAQGRDLMLYHAEPWYIACYIARQDLPLAEHADAYEKLVIKSQSASIHEGSYYGHLAFTDCIYREFQL